MADGAPGCAHPLLQLYSVSNIQPVILTAIYELPLLANYFFSFTESGKESCHSQWVLSDGAEWWAPSLCSVCAMRAILPLLIRSFFQPAMPAARPRRGPRVQDPCKTRMTSTH